MTPPSMHGSAWPSSDSPSGGLRQFWKNNALSTVVFVLFLLFWWGQSLVGWHSYNGDQADHGQQAISYAHYLTTSHFWEATAENWESEFFQMGFFVVLTVYLKQRGSAESKKYPDEETPGEGGEASGEASGTRAGALYRNSLALALLGLFLTSFAIHVWSGALEYSRQQVLHGSQAVSFLAFLGTSELWFQSLQNWQSEFLAIGALVVLTIYLRQEGSSQSKSVDAPNGQTGNG